MSMNQYANIPAEKFTLVQRDEKIHDKKLETKPIGYFKDAWLRFRKNKTSVVAAVIIMILFLFAIITPFVSHFTVKDRFGEYSNVLPRNKLLSKIGIWDGAKKQTEPQAGYDMLKGLGVESGYDAIVKEYEVFANQGKTYYKLKVDSYHKVGYYYKNLSVSEYLALQEYQNQTGKQILYPMNANHATQYVSGNAGANYWYKMVDESETTTGAALYDEDGNFQPNYYMKGNDKYKSLRIEGDPGIEDPTASNRYRYGVKNQTGYKVRVNYYEYFYYLQEVERVQLSKKVTQAPDEYYFCDEGQIDSYLQPSYYVMTGDGYYPSFLFGTNSYGQDIFTCLAIGARVSFALAIFVSVINLTIGAFYGAIEGYYGGVVDLTMERISDILASVPFIVVATLFQLHLADKVGPFVSLIFAFVMTGWVGMASRVRMQFYRFKGQEYILAARTLGAGDFRLMFKHIFPNSLGTIITGSVLAIPGVIFSESMLSYLNIVDFSTSQNLTSVGTMLSNGQSALSSYPHIILFPALFISLLEISFNLFGNGLRDAFNPSLRGVED